MAAERKVDEVTYHNCLAILDELKTNGKDALTLWAWFTAERDIIDQCLRDLQSIDPHECACGGSCFKS